MYQDYYYNFQPQLTNINIECENHYTTFAKYQKHCGGFQDDETHFYY